MATSHRDCLRNSLLYLNTFTPEFLLKDEELANMLREFFRRSTYAEFVKFAPVPQHEDVTSQKPPPGAETVTTSIHQKTEALRSSTFGSYLSECGPAKDKSIPFPKHPKRRPQNGTLSAPGIKKKRQKRLEPSQKIVNQAILTISDQQLFSNSIHEPSRKFFERSQPETSTDSHHGWNNEDRQSLIRACESYRDTLVEDHDKEYWKRIMRICISHYTECFERYNAPEQKEAGCGSRTYALEIASRILGLKVRKITNLILGANKYLQIANTVGLCILLDIVPGKSWVWETKVASPDVPSITKALLSKLETEEEINRRWERDFLTARDIIKRMEHLGTPISRTAETETFLTRTLRRFVDWECLRQGEVCKKKQRMYPAAEELRAWKNTNQGTSHDEFCEPLSSTNEDGMNEKNAGLHHNEQHISQAPPPNVEGSADILTRNHENTGRAETTYIQPMLTEHANTSLEGRQTTQSSRDENHSADPMPDSTLPMDFEWRPSDFIWFSTNITPDPALGVW
ncbi:hypothetical protein B0J12DRAFT_733142 [Macrophomina phaseolina]|uniref:Uncharacterized protein n=1 Tax=Macrophomina phaseolina TaxID=35725 RepID=A0ABQ8FT14_9PEZI|nr:hypothetical protein B0J12DRAFT_733142 [Macrophomina phaseolina]